MENGLWMEVDTARAQVEERVKLLHKSITGCFIVNGKIVCCMSTGELASCCMRLLREREMV